MRALPPVQLPLAGVVSLKGFRVLGDPPSEIRCLKCTKRWPIEGDIPTAEQVRDMMNHHKRRTRGKMAAREWRA